MTPAAILRDLTARGLSVRVDDAGNLRAAPASAVTPEVRALLMANKPALVLELAQERRRREVLELLRERPEITRAVAVDGDSDPVRVALAVRGVGTCELIIPADRWDPFAFLELLEQHGGSA